MILHKLSITIWSKLMYCQAPGPAFGAYCSPGVNLPWRFESDFVSIQSPAHALFVTELYLELTCCESFLL